MDIKSFIKQEVLAPRLQKKQVLAVYDPDCRYRDLCQEMSEEKLVVVDASESSITSRAQAIEALTALGRNEIDQLLIYVPTNKPIEEEEKQKDPFALYWACGAVFPDGDGDTYLSLCLKRSRTIRPRCVLFLRKIKIQVLQSSTQSAVALVGQICEHCFRWSLPETFSLRSSVQMKNNKPH